MSNKCQPICFAAQVGAHSESGGETGFYTEIEPQFVEDENLDSDREAFWVLNPAGPFF